MSVTVAPSSRAAFAASAQNRLCTTVMQCGLASSGRPEPDASSVEILLPLRTHVYATQLALSRVVRVSICLTGRKTAAVDFEAVVEWKI